MHFHKGLRFVKKQENDQNFYLLRPLQNFYSLGLKCLKQFSNKVEKFLAFFFFFLLTTRGYIFIVI